MPCRCLDSADDLFDGCERREPMRPVGQIGTGDAGEKIFCATGEPGDLVRDGRTEDKNEVVTAGRDEPINCQWYCLGKYAARDFLDLAGRKLADSYELHRVIPSMIVDVAERRDGCGKRVTDLCQFFI